jgi:hypothetical protein
MNADLTVTLWESNSGHLLLSLDVVVLGLPTRGRSPGSEWTIACWDMSNVEGSTFAADAEAILRGETGSWTVLPCWTMHSGASNPVEHYGWKCVAEYDGHTVMLADRFGGAEPGRAASIYLGVAAATR